MILLISINSYFQYSSYVFNELNYSKMGMISVASFFIASAIGTVLAPWFSRRFFDTYAKKFFVAALPHFLLITIGIAASACFVGEEVKPVENDGTDNGSVDETITAIERTHSTLFCSSFVMYSIVLIASILCGLGNALIWVL